MSTVTSLSAFTEPDRPADLQIRFVTVGGSYVDVLGGGEYVKNRWTCHGCKDSSRLPEQDHLWSIREKANGHASACRAIPLT
ncbi:hypothetical protein [Streptomyces sp. NRRL F-5123]|uniref:hypothetical protein n=1 Tax=Streptomyces sp. NRRL F-5123 TaxID=1463856 RepID=UPI0004E192B1|nr:hypothetical protein [Streptomyces sp. NRRL F-5123]